MIPENFIEQWRAEAPWQTLAMVEQDLVISRALVDLYNQPDIQTTLVFRGGTALNKLYLQPPSRYSEDIDLVQIKAGPIGKTIDAIQKVLNPWLGQPKRKLTERSAKLIYRYQSVDNTQARLKIEINTTEHFNVHDLKYIDYSVNSEWFQGKTSIYTYELDELIGTKLRALYQRRKGRDLFDLWIILNHKDLTPTRVVNNFLKYMSHSNLNITRAQFEMNLAEKMANLEFGRDIEPLLTPDTDWEINQALTVIQEKLITLLPGDL